MEVESKEIMENAKACPYCGAGEKHKRIAMVSYKNGDHKAVCENCSAEGDIGTYEYARFCWESGDVTIPIHSQKDVLKGCVALMQKLYDEFEDYLAYIGINLDAEDEPPEFRFTPLEVVRTLFLRNTSHSGGTSTAAKCRELGIDDAWDDFVFKGEDEEDV